MGCFPYSAGKIEEETFIVLNHEPIGHMDEGYIGETELFAQGYR